MNASTTSIVVYRSKWQEQADDFYFNHPEYIAGGVFGLVIIVLIAAIVDSIKRRNRNRRW